MTISIYREAPLAVDPSSFERTPSSIKVIGIPGLGLYQRQSEVTGRGARTIVKTLTPLPSDDGRRTLVRRIIRVGRGLCNGSTRGAVETELEIMRRLRAAGVAVPPLLGRYSTEHKEVIIEPYYRPLVDTVSTLTPIQKTRVMHQLIDSVARIHRAGIIHSDLKPSNVLLDDQDNPIIIDYDRSFDAEAPNWTGSTPAFTAPELRGDVIRQDLLKTIDWSMLDVYALGVTLYWMEHPDSNLSNFSIQRGLKGNEPRTRFIKWMLDPDPKRRPSLAQIEHANLGEALPPEYEIRSPLGVKSPLTSGITTLEQEIAAEAVFGPILETTKTIPA